MLKPASRQVIYAAALYLGVISACFLADRIESSLYGLKFQVEAGGNQRDNGISRTISLSLLRGLSPAPHNGFTVTWTGTWFVPVARMYAIEAGADDRVELADRWKSCCSSGHKQRQRDCHTIRAFNSRLSSDRGAVYPGCRPDVPDIATGSFHAADGFPESAGRLS